MEEKFEREVLDRLIVIETKMDMFTQTTGKVEEAYSMASKAKEDIEEIKERNKWLWRTSIGAVITGAIGILIAVVEISIFS
jgi:prefoldin subunit 5